MTLPNLFGIIQYRTRAPSSGHRMMKDPHSSERVHPGVVLVIMRTDD